MMSFVRRMFGSKSSIRKSTSTASDHSSDLTTEEVVDDSQFDTVDADLIDVFRLEKKITLKKEDLNTKFTKYVKQERKMVKLQNHIIQMDKELNELRRMLRLVDLKKNALEVEVECKKEELRELTAEEKTELETDVKRKELQLFKRYQNIKTKTDAKTLLATLKLRQTTLQNLEMLTFRKYLSNEYETNNDSPPKRPRCLNTPPKKAKRTSFQNRSPQPENFQNRFPQPENFQTRFPQPENFQNRFQYPTSDPFMGFQLFSATGSPSGAEAQAPIEFRPETPTFSDLDIEVDDRVMDDYEEVDVWDSLTPLFTDV